MTDDCDYISAMIDAGLELDDKAEEFVYAEEEELCSTSNDIERTWGQRTTEARSQRMS